MDAVGDILTFWTAVELLSPREAPHPKDGKKGGLKAIRRDHDLPWQQKHDAEAAPVRHLVYLGLSDIQEMVDVLRKKFGDDDQRDIIKTTKLAALACFVVDQTGLPVVDSFRLTSHGWAMGRLLSGKAWMGFRMSSSALRPSSMNARPRISRKTQRSPLGTCAAS